MIYFRQDSSKSIGSARGEESYEDLNRHPDVQSFIPEHSGIVSPDFTASINICIFKVATLFYPVSTRAAHIVRPQLSPSQLQTRLVSPFTETFLPFLRPSSSSVFVRARVTLFNWEIRCLVRRGCRGGQGLYTNWCESYKHTQTHSQCIPKNHLK